MNFIKKLIYLYPTLKILRAHRLGEYAEVKKYFTKLPKSYREAKIPFLIIKGRSEMIDSEYTNAITYFVKAIEKVRNSSSMNEDEKNTLLEGNNISTYDQKNVRKFILNN
ncbi:MAG: hypothetical protein ABXS93_09765, partial [Sulfurimonas sp.]